MHKGVLAVAFWKPLLWGEPPVPGGAGGTVPAPACPGGETEKGRSNSLSDSGFLAPGFRPLTLPNRKAADTNCGRGDGDEATAFDLVTDAL